MSKPSPVRGTIPEDRASVLFDMLEEIGEAHVEHVARLLAERSTRLAMILTGALWKHLREIPEYKPTTVIGFDSHDFIDVGETGTVYSIPQEPVRMHKLVVERYCAPHFDIMGLYVGVILQFPNNEAIPATVFSEETFAAQNLHFDVCQISQQIQIQVRNRGGAPARFQATGFVEVVR